MAKEKTKEIVPAFKPWKYEDSVAVAKPLVTTMEKASLDLVRELYAAQKALSNQGLRTDKTKNSNELTSSQMGTSPQTWLTYLSEIGLAKSTAYRLLTLYSPHEDKLYTPEEYKEALTALFLRVQATRVKRFGWEPEGWTPSLERRYQKWLAAEKIAADLEKKDREGISGEALGVLAQRLEYDPSVDQIQRFNNLCMEYTGLIDSSVKIEDPVHIVQFVEEAVGIEKEKDKRMKTLRSVVVILNDLLAKGAAE